MSNRRFSRRQRDPPVEYWLYYRMPTFALRSGRSDQDPRSAQQVLGVFVQVHL